MFFLIRKGESLRYEQFIKEIVMSFISSKFSGASGWTWADYARFHRLAGCAALWR